MKVMASKNFFGKYSELEQTFHSSSAKLISCSFMGSSVCSHEDLMTKWLFYSDRKCWVLKHGKSSLTVVSHFIWWNLDFIWIYCCRDFDIIVNGMSDLPLLDLSRLGGVNAGDWRFYTHCWNGNDGLSEFIPNDWKCR